MTRKPKSPSLLIRLDNLIAQVERTAETSFTESTRTQATAALETLREIRPILLAHVTSPGKERSHAHSTR